LSFIIAGIDTNVGKTVISAILCQKLGYDYWKPVQAGDLEQSDSLFIQNNVANHHCFIHPETHRFRTAASPHYAAALAATTIFLSDFVLPNSSKPIIVETAGGLMSPLSDEVLNIDCIKHLNLPVILVSKNYLGSINHTLLAINCLKQHNIPIKGLIFSGEANEVSQNFIAKYANVPILFCVPQFEKIDAAVIAQFAQTITIFEDTETFIPSKKIATLLSIDKNHVWHPFTQAKTATDPILIDRAHGCTLYAADGTTYIDAISSWWVNIHGHANRHIADAIAAQARKMEQVIFAGFTHAPAIELSEKLIQLLPKHFAKVFFSDNGSTSVEVALKMALQYWQNSGKPNKIKIIAFEEAYHGDTFGAMSIGGRNAFTQAFEQLLFEVIHIPLPTKGNFVSLKAYFKKLVTQENIAAFIFEPLVQGAAGMRMYEAKYLDKLIEMAQKKKVICIADEVMTGFGRTGKTFATDYLSHPPDIICLSKGITGGFLPLGITVCTQNIYDAFYSDDNLKTFFHGHSYTANPLACAAANKSIELLLTMSCRTEKALLGWSIRGFAKKICHHPSVKKVQYLGTILAIELNTPENTSYFNEIKVKSYQYFLSKGVVMRPLGNIIYIMPPYCMTEAELNYVFEVIEAALNYLL
jgi:adenosylmethionine---8-amino-7-oxononanoate aminotransferase